MSSENGPFRVVVTTIQAPTECLRRFAAKVDGTGGELLVVGDTKTPATFRLGGARFLSYEEQVGSGSRLALALPKAHYARKNLGYVEAIRAGASTIYETDDDNAPLASWRRREETTIAAAFGGAGWVNVYRFFAAGTIWPRGLPLDALHEGIDSVLAGDGAVRAPIQQGLADGEPDVDAVWRLTMPREVTFDAAPSVLLPRGAWCPFNSQSTWWFPAAYPLLYLPSFCSFRMTDIWRSFVAQRCLWAMGHGVVFHGPEVVQERNVHNLMRDFEQEVPGYLGNRRLAAALEELSLPAGEDEAGPNLARCYRALVGAGFLPEEELALVGLWLEAVGAASRPVGAEE